VGFASTRESDIEHVHQLLLRAAGSGSYGGRIMQSMKREGFQPFEKAAVVNVLVASLHADCFSSSGCIK
jgi:hypothetical protein